MQIIWRHQVALEAAAGGAGVGRRDGELHVGVGDVFLAVVEAGPFHHLLANGGEGAVATHYEVGLHHHL